MPWRAIGPYDGLALAIYEGRDGPVILTCARTDRGRDLRLQHLDHAGGLLHEEIRDLGIEVSTIAVSGAGLAVVLGDLRDAAHLTRGYVLVQLEEGVMPMTGGHCVVGGTAPARTWYFAEGYTGEGFDEYLTLMNPNSSPAAVTLTYYLASGGPVSKSVSVPAQSRYTVAVHETAEGVGRGQAVSTKVESSQPIVAERPMYFRYGGG